MISRMVVTSEKQIYKKFDVEMKCQAYAHDFYDKGIIFKILGRFMLV